MTEQSNNRRWQDKVVKDRAVDGNAGEECEWGLRQDWTGLHNREQDWVIIMVIKTGKWAQTRQTAMTQIHFLWNTECLAHPKKSDITPRLEKTEHFLCLWFSFLLTSMLYFRKRSSYCCYTCQASRSCTAHTQFLRKNNYYNFINHSKFRVILETMSSSSFDKASDLYDSYSMTGRFFFLLAL